MANSTFCCCFCAVVVLLLSSTLHSAPTASNETVDRDALLAFKSRITSCRLRRSIPKHLGNFTSLEDLSLADNNLTGELPSELGNFNLVKMAIYGNIKPHIFNMSTINKLSLVFNHFSEQLPSKLLQKLDIGVNKLSGESPNQELGFLSSLTQCCHLRRLEGFLPIDLCRLRNFGDFYASYSVLQGPIPVWFDMLKTLQRLFPDSKLLKSNVPSSLWNLKYLLSLSLSPYELSGSLSVGIDIFKVIGDLDLSWNQFLGEVPSSIDKAESLVILSSDRKMEAWNISMRWKLRIQTPLFMFLGKDTLKDSSRFSEIAEWSLRWICNYSLHSRFKTHLPYRFGQQFEHRKKEKKNKGKRRKKNATRRATGNNNRKDSIPCSSTGKF